MERLSSGIIAAGAALHYLSETRHHKLQHIAKIARIAENEYVWMDRFTIGNLELYHASSQNAVTLLDVIDKTISPMGGRLLKRLVALPLKKKYKITNRHEVVSYLIKKQPVLTAIQTNIKCIGDIERLISKVATGKVSPREVVQLKNSLEAILPIKKESENAKNNAIKTIGKNLQDCKILREKITNTLNEDAPVLIQKGNAIAKGVSEELDELRSIAKG